jgi:hypothetical protein
LNADLMVVGQDWGGKKYFLKHKGCEKDTNATNRNLQRLLQSISYRVPLPNERKSGDGCLYFTNAVLCLKRGNLVGPVPNDAVGNCARGFLCNQVELVRPKLVVTLGYEAYRAVCYSYGYLAERRITDGVGSEPKVVGYSSVLVPVAHCGHYGSIMWSPQRQEKDWERVRRELDNWKPGKIRLACRCF